MKKILIEHLAKKIVFSDGNGDIILSINNFINNSKFKNIYICNIEYSRASDDLLSGDKQFISFNDMVVQLDFDRLENDSEYYYYVFNTFFDFNRISNLYDQISLLCLDNKYGNYVGSINEDTLLCYMDYDIERFVYTLAYTKNMPEVYKSIFDIRKENFANLSTFEKNQCVGLFTSKFGKDDNRKVR